MDTPDDNWPTIIPDNFFPLLFSLVEQFSKETSDLLYTTALNKRMGTTNLTIAEIGHVAAK